MESRWRGRRHCYNPGVAKEVNASVTRSGWIAPEVGPDTLKTRPWGGRRLAALRGATFDPAAPIGESWEFSTLEGSESRARGGSLLDLLGAPLPFLVKLIDTESRLSIQLHPADGDRPDPSGAPTGLPGKEEAWIVLDAAPGARVRAGLANGIGGDEFERRLRAAQADPQEAGAALVDALRAIPVRRGSIILVPPRTVHAIEGGLLVAEIQQPTDCTFRLFDYGSERELHVDEGLRVYDSSAQARCWQPEDAAAGVQLEGDHLRLRPVRGPGPLPASRLGAPRLVVQVEGRSIASDGLPPLSPGDLRLDLEGDAALTLGNDALVVIGTID